MVEGGNNGEEDEASAWTEPYNCLPEASDVVKQLYFDWRDITKQAWEERKRDLERSGGKDTPGNEILAKHISNREQWYHCWWQLAHLVEGHASMNLTRAKACLDNMWKLHVFANHALRDGTRRTRVHDPLHPEGNGTTSQGILTCSLDLSDTREHGCLLGILQDALKDKQPWEVAVVPFPDWEPLVPLTGASKWKASAAAKVKGAPRQCRPLVRMHQPLGVSRNPTNTD